MVFVTMKMLNTKLAEACFHFEYPNGPAKVVECQITFLMIEKLNEFVAFIDLYHNAPMKFNLSNEEALFLVLNQLKIFKSAPKITKRQKSRFKKKNHFSKLTESAKERMIFSDRKSNFVNDLIKCVVCFIKS